MRLIGRLLMKVRAMKCAAAILTVIVLPEGPSAAADLLRPHFTVQLHVQASEASEESIVDGMANTLRQLGDVQVTTDGSGLWILYVNVTPIMDHKGLQGYAVSTVIADQYAAGTLQGMPSANFQTPAAEKTVKDLAKEQVSLREHLLLTCTVDGLPKAYAQIVEYFNETYLMPAREHIDNFNFERSNGVRRGL